ncbi:carboxypeptidase-like regulatory domain-containing protein [Gilvibacter sediminis]|uniref:carboxypeptidase-like regulatory domain-containing protein n=1 Tax=Gilvibacter sediminis TaxID=379071 RepID=UPI00234FE03B|nr:carboxypeptidase-like regulatory domain-containing protein [Gilvibacter sediminis]MDC7998565.1 hypothetical protein [Gilvibacter sediminis]
MQNFYLLFLFVFSALTVSAQEITRVIVKGELSAPIGEDLEGISIYNRSAQEGTITAKDGTFTLKMATNDRILVTALQFQSFTVIIDEGVIENKSIKIYLNPNVNLLEEVIVRPYDLTGNVEVDIGRVKVYDFDSALTFDYQSMEFEYDFKDDSQSRIRNVVSEEVSNLNVMQYGFTPLGILQFIGKDRKKRRQQQELNNLQSDEQVATVLRQRYNVYFFEDSFDIPQLRYDDFIYFVQEQGIPEGYLKPENEIRLLGFIKQQSTLYLERIKD